MKGAELARRLRRAASEAQKGIRLWLWRLVLHRQSTTAPHHRLESLPLQSGILVKVSKPVGKRHQCAPDLGLLTALCRRHVLSTGSAVLPEPYVPFIPTNWNGILVTAESQNLSQKNAEYRDWLLKQRQTKRIRRLYEREPIAIAPWNDGTIPVALRAAFSALPENTGVTNVVPWSQTTDDGRNNRNPDDELIEMSVSFWKDMLPAVRPKILLVCGTPGRKIFDAVGEKIPGMKTHFVCSPSSNFLSRVSGLFRERDLVAQFPDVSGIEKNYPHYFAKHRRNKIFFACHVTSLVNGEPRPGTV